VYILFKAYSLIITQRLKDELESIQLEAAIIITGATKLVSHYKLYQEMAGYLSQNVDTSTN